jgi:hypothetical protein
LRTNKIVFLLSSEIYITFRLSPVFPGSFLRTILNILSASSVFIAAQENLNRFPDCPHRAVQCQIKQSSIDISLIDNSSTGNIQLMAAGESKSRDLWNGVKKQELLM